MRDPITKEEVWDESDRFQGLKEVKEQLSLRHVSEERLYKEARSDPLQVRDQKVMDWWTSQGEDPYE